MVDPVTQTMLVFQSIAEALAPGLKQAGVGWEVFWLVFFLSYAMIYSLLNFVHFLKDNNAAKFIVALVLSFFISSNAWALAIIASIFPSLGVLLAVGLGIIILTAVFLPRFFESGQSKWVGYTALAFVIVYLISTALASAKVLGGGVTESAIASAISNYIGIIIAIAIIIGVIIFLSAGKGSRGGSSGGLFKISKIKP